MRVPHAALVMPGAARGSLGLARMPCLSEALMSPAYRTRSCTSPFPQAIDSLHMKNYIVRTSGDALACICIVEVLIVFDFTADTT